MIQTNPMQKVVQAVKSPLKGLIMSFGSLTRVKEVAAGLDVRGVAGESVGGVQYFSIFAIVE